MYLNKKGSIQIHRQNDENLKNICFYGSQWEIIFPAYNIYDIQNKANPLNVSN